MPIPVATPYKALVLGRWIAISNPAVAWMSILCECCCLSKGLCDGPITRPEEFYQVWCVWVWPRDLNIEVLRHRKKTNGWSVNSVQSSRYPLRLNTKLALDIKCWFYFLYSVYLKHFRFDKRSQNYKQNAGRNTLSILHVSRPRWTSG
jgi:hypothetical protein